MKDIAAGARHPRLSAREHQHAGGRRAACRRWRPDLLVVAAYGQILSKDVLARAAAWAASTSTPRCLPKYRGAAPIAWAIYHGENADRRHDHPHVDRPRRRRHARAGSDRHRPGRNGRRAGGAPGAAGRAPGRGASIDQIAAGTVEAAKQDKTLVTKAPKLTKEHGLIDWSRHGERCATRFGRCSPGRRRTRICIARGPPAALIVCKAIVVPDGTVVLENPQAGMIRLIPGEAHLYVETGAGDQVEILELQPAGKRRMNAADFLRGNAVENGWRWAGKAHECQRRSDKPPCPGAARFARMSKEETRSFKISSIENCVRLIYRPPTGDWPRIWPMVSYAGRHAGCLVAATHQEGEPREVEPWIWEALRLGAYQLFLLSQIPPHAALNETVTLAESDRGSRGFINGVLRALVPLLTREEA